MFRPLPTATSLAAAALAVAASLPAHGQAPGLEEGVLVEAGGKPIQAEVGHLVPCVFDWNGDGKKDLIVGQFSGGKVRFYPNCGTDSRPSFDKFEFMEAGGREISVPSG